jgi:anti-sigma factor RsiW
MAYRPFSGIAFHEFATFALSNPDAPLQARELSAVGEWVGADLTPERVAIPGLRFKAAAINLSYRGSPLGEVTYVDAEGEPVLFCLTANGGADAPMRLERRGELSLSSWSRAGRGYLVIARLPEEQVANLGLTLEKRF